MPLDVAVYHDGGRRSRTIAVAMADGARLVGDRPKLVSAHAYRGVEAAVAVFYGFIEPLRKAFADYRAAGKPVVCVDLGYWGRIECGRLGGYHKVSVNARHPTAYFQRRAHDFSRVRRFKLRVDPWRKKGKPILLAGMSGKAAQVAGFRAEEWERRAVAAIREHSEREILYRAKPSWEEARPLPGTSWCGKDEPLSHVLARCHAVVTHHSNVAVDGLVMGVPAFCLEGVAAPLALDDLAQIEAPHYPEERAQWLADIAWTQFCVAEMTAGVCWRHLKDEGLIP